MVKTIRFAWTVVIPSAGSTSDLFFVFFFQTMIFIKTVALVRGSGFHTVTQSGKLPAEDRVKLHLEKFFGFYKSLKTSTGHFLDATAFKYNHLNMISSLSLQILLEYNILNYAGYLLLCTMHF